MRLACSSLSSWFEKDADIITPNSFLADAARQQFVNQQLHLGKETWQRPGILSLEGWLSAQWRDARYASADLPSLLSPSQERALWRPIIEQEHPHLFDVGAAVRLAQNATNLLAHWFIPTDGDAWSDHADAREYLLWLRAIRRKCRDQNWILRSDILRHLPDWIAQGLIQPRPILFVGFESEWSPALSRLEKAFGGQAKREAFESPRLSAPAPLLAREDLRAEAEFAARHARKVFEKQSTSIALLVPSLSDNYSLIQRALRSVFFPQSLVTGAETAKPFHFAYVGLLVEQPVISAALLLLNVATGRINHADAGAILRSPFIAGAANERSQRAQADFQLRNRREFDFSFDSVERVCHQCPLLLAAFKKIRNLHREIPHLQDLSKWSAFISDVLAAFGWPNSQEEPLIENWKDQLSSFSALGLVLPPLSFADALSHLRRLLSQPIELSDWSAPIHVLDAAQARGLRFDHAIAIGLCEENWPPPVLLSPLVPYSLQRSNQIPGSTPESAQQSRSLLTQALFDSAPHTVASYHGTLAVAAAQFTTPVQEIPQWEKTLPQKAFKTASLEQLTDGQAPPLITVETFRGGSSVIKAQANCPFRAFAEFRLRARAPEDATFGYDSRDRGGFMHKSLENVWRKLESLQRLKITSPGDLRLLVREAVADAVKADNLGPLHEMSAAAERERLEELILEWLDLEARRHRHFNVEMIEDERKFEAHGLSLQLRVDRIDRLENGNLLLIDYKSAAPSKNRLEGARPSEPQLLVYAAAVGDTVDGVFFGQLKPRDVKATGHARHKHFSNRTPDERKDWDEYVEKSRGIVHSLAQEFVNGVASVTPLKGACAYCSAKPICRIQEASQSDGAEE